MASSSAFTCLCIDIERTLGDLRVIDGLDNGDILRDLSLFGLLYRRFAFEKILYQACTVKPVSIAKADGVQHFFYAVKIDHCEDNLELIPRIALFLLIQLVDVLVRQMPKLFLELLSDPVNRAFRIAVVRTILDEQSLAL